MKILKIGTVISTILALSLLTACQKPETATKDEKIKTSTPEKKSDTVEIPAFPENCDAVDTAIKNLEKSYSPEDLNRLNQLFKKCVASVPLETRYEWIDQSDKIYEYQISKLPKNVQNYITQLSDDVSSSDKKALAQLYKKMTPQEQYIAKNHKVLYLYQYNLGEGDYSVAQDPRYKLEIFAASLPEADQIYLKEIVKQEDAIDGSIDKDAGLSASFTELSNWIIFWENYLTQYPNSHFNKQVKNTIKFYQGYLFRGLENTPVFEIEDYTVKLDSDADKAIHSLAKTTSPSGEKAKKFLNYFNHYPFSKTPYDEKTGSQADYNLFINETLEGVKRFKENNWNDLNKLLDLDHL